MRASLQFRALTVLAAVAVVAGCAGESVTATGEPAPAPPPVKTETYPDPPPEVADEVAGVVRQWVTERADENGIYDIPPRGGQDVAGALGDFHTVHQKDADTYSVCVDFLSGEDTYDVDFFIDRDPEGLKVRDAFLHKINGEVISG
jgi:hypothetical protein